MPFLFFNGVYLIFRILATTRVWFKCGFIMPARQRPCIFDCIIYIYILVRTICMNIRINCCVWLIYIIQTFRCIWVNARCSFCCTSGLYLSKLYLYFSKWNSSGFCTKKSIRFWKIYTRYWSNVHIGFRCHYTEMMAEKWTNSYWTCRKTI